MKTFLEKYYKKFPLAIFLLALFSMLGSLYYSNFGDPISNIKDGIIFFYGNGLPPCQLCWYSRIFMYPIVILGGWNLFYTKKEFVESTLPLMVLGFLLSVYHSIIQKAPIFEVTSCGGAIPCSDIQVEYFGFITIPMLALVAYILMLFLAFSYLKFKKD